MARVRGCRAVGGQSDGGLGVVGSRGLGVIRVRGVRGQGVVGDQVPPPRPLTPTIHYRPTTRPTVPCP